MGGVCPPGPLQHSWPRLQQAAPQQNWLGMQAMPWHGTSMQVPLLQYGCMFVALPQAWPQAPQLAMSFSSSTHLPLQHAWFGPHGLGHGAPLELELELELELDAPPTQQERQFGL
jgi:hypothetical protein